MIKSNFNIEKAKASVLFIINNIGETDLLKIFKILYFAERNHLAKYGRLILNDDYVAMKNGPVPSKLYDLFKIVRGDLPKQESYNDFVNAFEVKDTYIVSALEQPDFDELSKSNIVCIEDAIRDNYSLTFEQLSSKSHQYAWNNASRDDYMNFLDIATEGGANEEMIKYIIENKENSQLVVA